jgi:sigma-B regulation protein RsbU (phosphoserine phosphatase)
MLDKYRENITSLVKMAAELVPGDKVDIYMDTLEKDEDYERMFSQFTLIQEKNNLEYIYGVRLNAGGDNILVQSPIEADGKFFDLGYFEDKDEWPDGNYDFVYNILLDPDAEKIIITTSEFGYLITAYEPVCDSSGKIVALVGADMSMDKINRALTHYTLNVILIAVVIIVLFVTIYLMIINKNVVRPMQILVNSATEFVETGYGDDKRLSSMKIDIRTGDEIENLAAAFNKMTADIVVYIHELTGAAAERERVETELHVATLIQKGMLPHNFNIHDNVEIFASMRPAKDVGGDFYDFFVLDKNRVCLVIGDVSGKGVPAALFMAMAKATVKDLALRNLPVDELMYQANNTLCKNNEQGMFLTLYVAILETDTGLLTWSDAGHQPAILKKPGGKAAEISVKKKGMVVGTMEDYQYRAYSVTLENGDMIFLYTDGVSEANNEAQEMYGTQRLLDAILACSACSAQDLCETVYTDVERFTGTAPQFDDITMMTVVYRADTLLNDAKKLIVSAVVESLDEVLAFLTERLEAIACPAQAMNQILIAAEEIFVNIAHYAYPNSGSAEVCFTANDNEVIIAFSDNGKPFNPLEILDPDIKKSPEEREAGGLGIFLVKKLMSSVAYEYTNERNVLTITKKTAE